MNYLFTFGYAEIRRIGNPLGVAVSSVWHVMVRWETEEWRAQTPLAPLPVLSIHALSFWTSAEQLSLTYLAAIILGPLKGKQVLKDLYAGKHCVPEHQLWRP